MSTAVPQIPPRPARAQAQQSGGNSSLDSDIPKIPPRPTNRRIERSASPHRESFAPSPLNEPVFRHPNQSNTSLYSNGSANNSSLEIPHRPSSIVLPSIGHEGDEYAEAFSPSELGLSPTQTRNVANDLKLHAPKPSLPNASAKQRVSTVTRTDSGQAASFGIGKPGSDDKDPASRDLKAKASFASQQSNSTERRPSSVESEHGIPEIGQRVPMYPNAGDVQAPSPSVFASHGAPGIGFHNDGSKPRNHTRRISGRGVEIPSEAYGKHGHGQIPHDRFEKAYYEKHPELYTKETSHYHGPFAEDRKEWTMSSEDLNKIVRGTASRGSGVGASANVMGPPSEQVGFQASEEYASRMSSPRPQSSGQLGSHANLSQTHVDSPLRHETLSVGGTSKSEFEGTLSRKLKAPSELSLHSETEDEDVIHVDGPRHRFSKVYGAEGYTESAESLGQYTGHDGAEDDDYSAPILAPDEVAKEPFGWELQPAVSPMHAERRGSAHDEHGLQYRSGSASSSRPSSRPGSIHGIIPGLRMSESKHLEDLDEYEPLFPDEEGSTSTKKPLTAADKLKRPDLKNRKFPSQDVWEDTPNSLQYTATVSSPQLPEDEEGTPKVAKKRDDETPEQAFARRQEELAEMESKGENSHKIKEKKPWANKAHVVEETRPVLKQHRFPSRDIWEDTPDSLQLHTTVAGPQTDEGAPLSPPTINPAPERPTTGAVAYHQEKAAAGLPLASDEGRATTGIAAIMKPEIPARPAKSQPAIPERPTQKSKAADDVSPPVPSKTKPVVPSRPSKAVAPESSENVPLSKVTSDSSATSARSETGASAVSKTKPPVPSRPVGSKIAALQGGFMSDLNKRLQLGPQAPKKEEIAPEGEIEEKEKAPLVDARKGRARGPVRRAPGKSPTPAVAADTTTSTPSFGVCMPATLWQIDPEEDVVTVPTILKEEQSAPATVQFGAPALATNTAGESLHEPSEAPLDNEKPVGPPSAINIHPAEELDDALKAPVTAETHINDSKLVDEEPANALEPETTAEDLSGSTSKAQTQSIVE